MINHSDFAPAKVASAVTVMSGERMGGRHDGSPLIIVGFRTSAHVVEAMAIGRQMARKLTDELLALFADLNPEHSDEYMALRQLFSKLQEEDHAAGSTEEGGLFNTE